MQLQEMTKLRQLAIQILIYRIKTVLQLLWGQLAHWVMSGVVVHVRKKNGLRESWFNMLP